MCNHDQKPVNCDSRTSIVINKCTIVIIAFAGPPNVQSSTEGTCKDLWHEADILRDWGWNLLPHSNSGLKRFSGILWTASQTSGCHATQFQSFPDELLFSHGVLQWRKLSDDVNIVIMSDFSEESGKPQPLKYVHVTARNGERQVIMKCTCGIYKKICGTVMKHLHLAEGVKEAVLDEDFTCMHCKFYKMYLHEHRGELLNQDGSTYVISSLQVNTLGLGVGDPVTLMVPASIKATTKLSVLAGNTCSIVNLHFTPVGGCFAKCQNGMCHVHFRNKKKIPKIFDHERGKGEIVSAHGNLVDQYWDPKKHLSNLLCSEGWCWFWCTNFTSKISFSVDTGPWELGATSQYQPTLDEQDPHLIQSTGEHHEYVTLSNILPTMPVPGSKTLASLECVCMQVRLHKWSVPWGQAWSAWWQNKSVHMIWCSGLSTVHSLVCEWNMWP